MGWFERSGSGGRRRRGVGLAVSTGLLVMAGVVVPGPASAATVTVCDVGPADFTSIASAVAAAAAGDTVAVCAGTFTEPSVIDIDKPLTLRGAQAGVDARTRTAVPETVVNSSGGEVEVSSPGVTIDGFSFTDQTQVGQLESGVATRASATVVNNIFARNAIGLYLNTDLDPQNPDPPTTLVRHNLFDSNNSPSPGGSGNGIYSDSGLRNAVIEENRFVGNANASILIAAVTPGVAADIEITRNVGDNQILLVQTADVAVRGNRILASATHGLHLGGGTSNVSAVNNWFVGQARYGVRIRSFGVGPNTGFRMHGNCIAHSGWAGLEQDPGTHTGTVDATRNWWGASNGPAATTATVTQYQDGRWVDADGTPFDDNPTAGWGDPLSGEIDGIDASGFLTAPTAAPCPALPTVTLHRSRRLAEGDSGTRSMTFPSAMNTPYYLRTQFTYLTSDGTATAGSDYQPTEGTVTLPAGSVTVPDITVPIIGDLVPEGTQRFTLSLAAPINTGGGRQASTGVILDNDVVGEPSLRTRTSDHRIAPGRRLFVRVHLTGVLGVHPAQAVARLYGPFVSRTSVACSPRHAARVVRWRVDNGWNRSPAVRVSRPGVYSWRVSTRANQDNEAARHPCALAAETTMIAKPAYRSPIVNGGFAGTIAGRPLLRGATPVLRIPDINLRAAVRPVGMTAHKMNLPRDVRKVGWLTRSARPADTIGRTVLAGHVSDWHDTPGAMWNLHRIRHGDIATLRDANHQHRFRVIDKSTYDRDHRLPHRLFRTTGRHRLVLITCTDKVTRPDGHFHYTRYLVVIARPVHP